MKVLIFGSTGLVGSSVVKRLQNSINHLDVFASSRKDTNLFSSSETVKKVKEVEPDVVVIAAARVGGIVANNTYRYDFINENLKIIINIFEACRENKNIKIINLGSSCIYPLNAENPIKEDYFMNGKLEHTNSPYAMAKIAGIEIGRSMNSQFGHNVINLMPTNLYGPNDNFDKTSSHVIPGLIRRMHEAKISKEDEFKIWGSGNPLREFLFVDDLANCIEFIINKDVKHDLINVGSGVEISILDLAELIKNVVGYEGKISNDLTKPDGNPRKLLDSSIINSYGWEPEISLEEGLVKTYDWFLKNLN